MEKGNSFEDYSQIFLEFRRQWNIVKVSKVKKSDFGRVRSSEWLKLQLSVITNRMRDHLPIVNHKNLDIQSLDCYAFLTIQTEFYTFNSICTK